MTKFTYEIERDFQIGDFISRYYWTLYLDESRVKSGWTTTQKGAKRAVKRAKRKYAPSRIVEQGDV